MFSKIINSAKKITPFGGLFFVINDLKNKGLAKLIDTHLGKRVKQAKYSYSDIILNWSYCNLCGAERLEDIEKLRDSLDMKLPSHDALGTVMKSFATKTETITKAPNFVIQSQLRSKLKDIPKEHLDLIVDKLCRDGYANKGDDSEWAVTYEGAILIASGGYKASSKQIRKIRTLTTLAVVASLIVGAYYGTQLLDYVYHVFRCGACECVCY